MPRCVEETGRKQKSENRATFSRINGAVLEVDNGNIILGFRAHKAKLHQDTLSMVSLLQK